MGNADQKPNQRTFNTARSSFICTSAAVDADSQAGAGIRGIRVAAEGTRAAADIRVARTPSGGGGRALLAAEAAAGRTR